MARSSWRMRRPPPERMAKWDGEWSGHGEAHAYEAGYKEAGHQHEAVVKAARNYVALPGGAAFVELRMAVAALAADSQPAESRSMQRRKAMQKPLPCWASGGLDGQKDMSARTPAMAEREIVVRLPEELGGEVG